MTEKNNAQYIGGRPKRRRVAAEANKKKDDKGPAGGRFHCNYCEVDISYCVRVKCSICPDFDLCVDCFAAGVELDSHKSTHGYSVLEKQHYPLFCPDWGADEELLLLEALEMFGVGNWEKVAEHIGTKNRVEASHHYFEKYIRCGPTAPLPNLSKILTTRENRHQTPVAKPAVTYVDADGNKPPTAEGITGMGALAPLPPLGIVPTVIDPTVPASTLAKEEAEEPKKESKRKEKELPHESGFIAKRDEFDVDYDADAEQTVCLLDFKGELSQLERDLRIKILNIYNNKLTERQRRKKFLIDRHALTIKVQDRRRPKEEREMAQSLRPFARFMSPEDFEKLVKGRVRERELRRQIWEAQGHRLAGLTKLDEIDEYESQKKKRDNEKERRKALQSAAYLMPQRKTQRLRRWQEDSPQELAMLEKAKEQSRLNSRKPNTPLEVSSMQGVEVLSVQERVLCSSLRLAPSQYMVVKDMMIQENFRLSGMLRKKDARKLIKMDVNKTSKVYDFFVENGLVGTNLPPDPRRKAAQASKVSVGADAAAAAAVAAAAARARAAASGATAVPARPIVTGSSAPLYRPGATPKSEPKK